VAHRQIPVGALLLLLLVAGLPLHIDLAAVERSALLLIGKQIVRRVYFLEFFVGVFIGGIQIRVMFLGQIAVGGFNLRLSRIFAYA